MTSEVSREAARGTALEAMREAAIRVSAEALRGTFAGTAEATVKPAAKTAIGVLGGEGPLGFFRPLAPRTLDPLNPSPKVFAG